MQVADLLLPEVVFNPERNERAYSHEELDAVGEQGYFADLRPKNAYMAPKNPAL
jgi:hypothetical protein